MSRNWLYPSQQGNDQGLAVCINRDAFEVSSAMGRMKASAPYMVPSPSSYCLLSPIGKTIGRWLPWFDSLVCGLIE
jgi:hypothetical protein